MKKKKNNKYKLDEDLKEAMTLGFWIGMMVMSIIIRILFLVAEYLGW